MYEFSSMTINNVRHEDVTGQWKRDEKSLHIETDEISSEEIFAMLLRNKTKIDFIEFRREDGALKGIAGPYRIRSIDNNYVILIK
ncbi:hypothetical protein [Terribacillus saccharophilus]|uniref:hypothetical protein n=1 Tax=Terribacillus saccharophilus TaxID=361277 RepID=UPI003D276AF8